MQTDRKGKFNELLGNWTKRDAARGDNIPFIARLGNRGRISRSLSPRRMSRMGYNDDHQFQKNEGIKKRAHHVQNISDKMTDSTSSTFPAPVSYKQAKPSSDCKAKRRSSMGDLPSTSTLEKRKSIAKRNSTVKQERRISLNGRNKETNPNGSKPKSKPDSERKQQRNSLRLSTGKPKVPKATSKPKSGVKQKQAGSSDDRTKTIKTSVSKINGKQKSEVKEKRRSSIGGRNADDSTDAHRSKPTSKGNLQSNHPEVKQRRRSSLGNGKNDLTSKLSPSSIPINSSKPKLKKDASPRPPTQVTSNSKLDTDSSYETAPSSMRRSRVSSSKDKTKETSKESSKPKSKKSDKPRSRKSEIMPRRRSLGERITDMVKDASSPSPPTTSKPKPKLNGSLRPRASEIMPRRQSLGDKMAKLIKESSRPSTPDTSKSKHKSTISNGTRSSEVMPRRRSLGDPNKTTEWHNPFWKKPKTNQSEENRQEKRVSKRASQATQSATGSTAATSRPSLDKNANPKKSKRNHLLREASRKKNLRKSVKKNKSNVRAHRIGSVQSFSPPVFQKDYAEKQLILKLLKNNFIFQDLAPLEMKAFVQAFEKIEMHKGLIIIKQGDVGDYFYIIGNGTVTFEVNGRSAGSATKGESFGELALLYASPRAATVKAASDPTQLFRVDQRTFQYIMESHTREMELEKIALLRKLPFLKDFVDSDVQQLGAAMTPLKFEEGNTVVKKGEIGDAFYIVKDGTLAVTDISVGDTTYNDVKLGPGDYFGERALVTSEPRAANVRGLSSGTLFSIDRYTFEKILGKFSRVIMKSQDRTKLQGVSVFKAANLDTAKYELLASHIVDKTYKATETIFKEDNDIVPALYLIREGKVQLSTKDGSRKEVIEAGGYFGADMLLADVRDQVSKSGMTLAECTATVLGDTCTCGLLTLADCRLILDTKAFVDPENSRLSKQRRRMSSKSGNRCSTVVRDSLRSSFGSQVAVDSLTRHSVLGEGQFGEVWLVSADVEDMSESFALKIQSKDNTDPNGCLDVIRREAEILHSLNHPFIVDLIRTHETDELVYMLLGLVEGGELWDVIHRQDDDGNWSSGIPHDHAKFYGLVVADTLAYIHSQNIAFRDLKPENVLIDEDGYPIIVDFGFAKKCTEKTYTFCGTPNYLAPEVITNRGHGAGVDHWALGVMIYEMLVGENPFYYQDMDQVSLFEAICQEEYFPLPDTILADAFHLIDRLLEKNPVQRLGMLSGGERDVLTHEWFGGLDLSRLQLKKIKAPWIPPPKQVE